MCEMPRDRGCPRRRDLIARARAGVCASLFPEPFCGVHVEMGLGGLPVLTTDVGVFTETVVDGKNGWRCKEFNDFVIAMEKITEIEPQTCHEMAMDYQMDRVVLRYQDYFERIHAAHSADNFWYLRPEKKSLEGQKRYLPEETVQAKLAALKAAPKTELGDTYHPGGADCRRRPVSFGARGVGLLCRCNGCGEYTGYRGW